MYEFKVHELDSRKRCPDNELLADLNKYLEWVGIYNPFEKIYIETKNLRNIATAIFMLSISHLSKLFYAKHISTLIGKKLSESIDGTSFVVGVVTVLKQFHIDIMHTFIGHFAQYVVSMANYNLQYVRIDQSYSQLKCVEFFMFSFRFQFEEGIGN